MKHFFPVVSLFTAWVVTFVFVIPAVEGQVSSFPGRDGRSASPTETVPELGPQVRESFLINSAMYLEKEKTPHVRTTTMVFENRVYDFLSDPEEVIIYDELQQRFILLSPVTKRQTSLSLSEVLEFSRSMKSFADQVKNTFTRSCLTPEFEITTDSKTDETVFTASKLTYRVKSQIESKKGLAKWYAGFANNYAVLNCMIAPQNIPPFARIEVNNYLAEKNWLPEEIEVTMYRQFKPLSIYQGRERIRLTYTFINVLGNREFAQIRKAGEYFGRFEHVSFSEYQNLLSQTLNPEDEKSKPKSESDDRTGKSQEER